MCVLSSSKPGKRHCIGESLARDELFLIFTRLIQASRSQKALAPIQITTCANDKILAFHLLCLPWYGSTIPRSCGWVHSCAKVNPEYFFWHPYVLIILLIATLAGPTMLWLPLGNSRMIYLWLKYISIFSTRRKYLLTIRFVAKQSTEKSHEIIRSSWMEQR